MKLAMYILVNEEIKISKGKLAGQVGHAVSSWIYKYCLKDVDLNSINLFNSYMEDVQAKIILKCPEAILEELENSGHITIRDAGLTELKPNTLTCVNLGIYDRDSNVPDWIKALKLYNK